VRIVACAAGGLRAKVAQGVPVRFPRGFGRPPGPPDPGGGGTALLLAKPAGQWLVGLGGGLVIGGGLAQLYRAYRADFRDKIKLNEMSATEKQWVIALGRFGYAAQGVVVGIIGVLLIVAAAHARPKEARAGRRARRAGAAAVRAVAARPGRRRAAGALSPHGDRLWPSAPIAALATGGR